MISASIDDLPAPTKPDPLVGSVVGGRFRVVELIGRGAMGRVYKATQLSLNRPVAIKFFEAREFVDGDDSFRRRFMVEAALTGRLSHPNTVRVLDAGQTGRGHLYLAMELISGESLDRRLARGPLPWQSAVSIALQIARAVREAHELGVVHRDLKPANIMLVPCDDGDFVKVLDFGLAKSFLADRHLEGRAVTQQGMMMGSPPYMAPEQGERNEADPRSDIYALGILLYECLTGTVPFRGNSPLDIVLKHMHEPLPRLRTPDGFDTIPHALRQLTQRCLAKNPADRFQIMEDVTLALSEILKTKIDLELPPAPFAAEQRSEWVHPLLLALGFFLALSAGSGLGYWALQQRSAAASPSATAGR